MDTLWLALPGCAIWLAVAVLPWRPWSTRERLDGAAVSTESDLSSVTVLIPARDEREHIVRTLQSVAAQGAVRRIILVDDQSTDGTAEAALAAGVPNLMIVAGVPLPAGWTGKLWALEQGRRHVDTPCLLLLDADIELRPGMLAALLDKMREQQLALVSLMARLRMLRAWEKMLMPAFVYFFRLLYPFRLVNSRSPLVAGAAGGCILIETAVLESLGGFDALRGEIIDDCTLARRVKERGRRIWLGLTHSVVSQRPYDGLGAVWKMVARTAYTQLRYSPLLLAACTILMLAAFILPFPALLSGEPAAAATAAAALALMAGGYIPLLRYYDLSPAWAITLPLAGALFLLMTWDSAWRHWQGSGVEWKDRAYAHH